MPELRGLLEWLGVAPLLECIVNSAEIGYEKPRPQAFATVLAAMGNPAEAWMLGDNADADILGAEAAGLRAILVRNHDARVARRGETLRHVRDYLDAR